MIKDALLRKPTPPHALAVLCVLLTITACGHLERNNQHAFKQTKLSEIDAAIVPFIGNKQMPGGVFHLERNGVVYEKAYGFLTYESNAEPTRTDIVFDAASLTKVVATTPAVMLLVESGKISLDAPLATYLPECSGNGKDAMLVRHLLTHTSGLAAGIPAKPEWRGADTALTLACAQMPTNPPGTLFRYSDINFILLGHLVARVSGMPLDSFVAEKIFAPLGMNDTTYLPLQKINSRRIAPTNTLIESDITRTLQGDVHDPTARRMGGVAGHAGLFTTVADLARFARMMLGEGELNGVRVLQRDSVRQMRSVQSPAAVPERRGIGWDIDTSFSRPRGSVFPIGSFGHTGFTGCILWMDPFSNTFYVFLSNRVYPKDGTNILPLYAKLGTLSAEAIVGFDFANVPGALTLKPLEKPTNASRTN
jgi:CubicO group peptidase (beta-lactamase class C family)